MGCLCRMAMAQLASELEKLGLVPGATPTPAGIGAPGPLGLPSLPAMAGATPASGGGVSVSAALSADLAAAKIAAVADWLAARGLPAAPWQPDPAWRTLQLPTPRLSASAVATISGLVQLRASAQQQLGIDPLQAAQADALRRIIATLNQRLAAMPPLTPAARAWITLARENDQADMVALALRENTFSASAELTAAFNEPGGVPMREWGPLLRPLRLLAPLLAAARQLGGDGTETATLAESLRVLARLSLPPLAQPARMAELAQALAAIQRLRDSLGADVLRQGLAAARAALQRKQMELAQILARNAPPGETPEQLLLRLPRRAVVPTSLATPAVVAAAQGMAQLAAVSWSVPENLPQVGTGLAALHLVAQLQLTLGSSPVRAAPCGSQCDAAALLRAANAAAA